MDKDKKREYNRGWNKKNKDRTKEYQKEHYQKNKDKILKRHKEWRQKNKERIREWNREYDIRIRKHKKCKYCGAEFIATREHPIYCSDECSKAHKEEYYQKNKDKIKARMKKYNEKNKERLSAQHKEYWKEYYPQNKEKVSESGKKWYQKNIDRLRLTHREYYQKNKDKLLSQGKEHRQIIRQEFLLAYKKGKRCAKCGWKEHSEILQFHHEDRKQKEFTIGNLSAYQRNSPEFQAEVKKCILLCPNCHFLLHIKHKKRVK